MRKYIFLIIFFTLFNLTHYIFLKPYTIPDSTKIIINPGMKLREIASLLYQEKIIKSEILFIFWAKINNLEKKFKFGEYVFESNISLSMLSNKLLEGKSIFRKLTIIEGSSKYDLLMKLKQLFPSASIDISDIPEEIIANTYLYEATDNFEKIIKNISILSKKKAELIWNNRNKNIPIEDIFEMFILASIVEKETAIENEKNLVAGVFYNRLNKKMRLQSDPTVEFSITLGENKLGRKLLRKDLKFKSDYNTYIINGLPPGPICYPGVESMEGVANPSKTKYIYFVADKINGGHLFSSNYEEHKKNIRKMRKIKNE